MRRPPLRKTAGLTRWHNGKTSLGPTGLAAVFAAENFSGPQLADALGALDSFRADPGSLKAVEGKYPRSEFGTALDYLKWAQFLALFKKSTDGGSLLQRKEAAKRGFERAELRCKIANKRLRWYGARPNREPAEMRVLLTRAKGFIAQVLGNFSEATLAAILEFARPGGGVAVGTRDRLKVSLPFKLGDTDLCVSDGARWVASLLVEGSPAWFRLVAEVDWAKRQYRVPYVQANHNRIAFVPKDAKTLRTIAVEPHLNMCLQLGVDAYFKRRLRSFGVDLSSQTRNQRLAKLGAACWQSRDPLVTLDLEAASDSLSVAAVERLLPPSWVEFLGCLRSEKYVMAKGDAPVEYQKWSSMGNGYTFSLETLVFWALAKACLTFTGGETVGVYGDDIIVPRSTALLLIEVLRYLGFRTNPDKTCLFGPFRESCGEDYFGDERVVPCYLRGISRLRPTDIYRVVNLLSKSPVVSERTRQACYQGHTGVPIVYGLEGEDPSQCWWASLDFLRKVHAVRWHAAYQSWQHCVARFRPHRARIPVNWGYASSLLGNREVSDPWLQAKSSLKGRGLWSLSVVTAG